jgi:hypothetical protein
MEQSSDDSSSDEDEEMSYTSDDGGSNDLQNLMALIKGSKNKPRDKADKIEKVGKKENGDKKDKAGVEVKFGGDSIHTDLKMFNTKSKKLIQSQKQNDGEEATSVPTVDLRKLFVAEDEAEAIK